MVKNPSVTINRYVGKSPTAKLILFEFQELMAIAAQKYNNVRI